LEYRIIYDKDFRRETVPASNNEYLIVDKLRDLFREHADWVKYIDIPTSSWFENECYLELNGESIPCKALPYTSTCEVEGYFNKALLMKNSLKTTSKVEDPIYFIQFPEELDVTKYIVLKLYEKGAKAVIFYDKKPGVYRRSVIVGCETYSLYHGSPPPIPVVSITREDYTRIEDILRKSNGSPKIRLYVNAYTKHNLRSRIVLAGINGSGEKEIHITAHHDHWFTGFSDDLIGVETLYQLIRGIREWRGVNLVFISFSSEEIGAPYYMSWYWAWGSRYYLRVLDEKNDAERVIADVNIDAIYKYPLEIYGNPSLSHCIEKIARKYNIVYRGYDHMDFDSFSYTLHGVPALTITTIDNIDPVYHSNIDDGSSNDKNIVNNTIEVAYELIKCISENRPRYKYIVEYVKNEFDKINMLETRVLVSKVENLWKTIRKEEELIRFITKNFTKVVYIPGVELEYETGLFTDLVFLGKILNNLDKYIGKIARIYSYDVEITCISPTQINIDETRYALKTTIANKAHMVNQFLEEKIAYYVLREKVKSKDL